MPIESRRRKDDTWTSEELNQALKGSKDDMLRKKRRDEEGDHRRHREEVNGSDHKRRDGDKDRHRSKSHKDRGDSADRVKLSEEDRERMRLERRAKKEGGKEEKPSRHKESSKTSKVIDSDEDDRKRRHHRDREEDKDRHGERRHHRDRDEDRERRHHRDREDGESGSHRHKDEKSERRHQDRDREHKKDRDHRKRDDDERDHRRHRDDNEDDNRRRKHHDDDDRKKRHHDEGSDRRKRRDEESRRHEEDDEERERRRQERREKREKEKSREKDTDDREKERSHRRSERKTEDEDDHERRRKERSDRERDKEKEREREKRREREREEEAEKYRKSQSQVSQSNGRHKEEDTNNAEEDEDDDYNYEEDFEDYEDDFEDDEDPEMKEEGEMEEVLRALDEENNRLASTSRRSNWSDSTELSDERFKDNHEDEPRSRAAPRAKTFINFISAKQRVMDNTVAGHVRKRFEDLSKLIELDVSAFDMFDLPPVKEYELYIRSFGRSDTQQAYVQTRDDDVDRDIQTEEIEVLSKWTQHPPDEDTAVGGEGINVQALDQSSELVKKTDPAKVTQFLDRVGQWLFTVLEEESGDGDAEERRDRESRPTASFSENVSQLGRPNFLAGRQVLRLSFCVADPNSLLSIHSSLSDDSEPNEDLSTIRASSPVEGEKLAQLSTFSLICVWNLSHPAYPQRICGSEMQITCGCFSPTKASLVFGGMRDGSVALWDLREPGSLHHSFEVEGLKHLVRFPTYNTAGLSECHQTPVVSIAAVYSGTVG
ncbi:WD repeat-containing protein 60-like, partial [Elysia marginata]